VQYGAFNAVSPNAARAAHCFNLYYPMHRGTLLRAIPHARFAERSQVSLCAMRLKHSVAFAVGTFCIASIAVAQEPTRQTQTPALQDTSPAAEPPATETPPAKEETPASSPDSKSESKPDAAETKSDKEKPKKLQAAAKEAKEEEHKPADPDTGKSSLSNETLGLLPNPYVKQGIKFTLSYVGEALADVAGGRRQGAIYDGRLNAAVDLDFAKLANWRGLSFHANVFQIHGQGLSRNYVGNLITVSSIEALATTRLYEIWFEQKFGNDKFSIRAGQLAADTEFLTSKYTDVFINATYGWPTITAINLPSGGPSPPLAAVGARFKGEFNDNFTWLSAIFNGDPAGPGPDDPQSRNRYGLNFRVSDPPLFINEIQYAYNNSKNAKGLPGTVKFGGWYHAGAFNDQHLAANGLSQADPNAAAMPAQVHSNFGLYAVFEQQLLTFPGGDGTRGLGVFTRVSANPSDRNLIDLYADGGLNLAGPLASRPNDKIGLGFAYARISDRARELDRDFGLLANSPRPIRDYEALLSLGYLAEIKQGWNLYPSVQYIVHPGAGYVMDDGMPKKANNALVIGARTVLKF
jgi:porin